MVSIANADPLAEAVIDTAAALATDDALGFAGGVARTVYHGAKKAATAELERYFEGVASGDAHLVKAAKVGRNLANRHLGPTAARLANALLMPVAGGALEGLWE